MNDIDDSPLRIHRDKELIDVVVDHELACVPIPQVARLQRCLLVSVRNVVLVLEVQQVHQPRLLEITKHFLPELLLFVQIEGEVLHAICKVVVDPRSHKQRTHICDGRTDREIVSRRILVMDVHGRDSVGVVDGIAGDGNLPVLRRAHSREAKRTDNHTRHWIIHHRVVSNYPIQLRCALGEAIGLPILAILPEIEEVDH